MHARTCQILLLEDEPLILMDLEIAAEDAGCIPLCASNVTQAMKLIGPDRHVDVAILDVSLKGNETCLPVARALQQLGIPFLLHSGDLDRKDETVRELDAQLIAKPASAERVIEAAMRLKREPSHQSQTT
ncbi:response regulator [Novosphingobium aquimarinum]|uniref:response regulator n=1 Tax=Novosphingobium aquimarinum TaxID=2682494 RepID=UPI0012ECADE8|nr:response regulator [Novosphingobium aquimarinum]